MLKRFFLLTLCLATGCAATLKEHSSGWLSTEPSFVVGDDKGTGRGALEVTQEVMDGWNFLYRSITDTEFALCLEGWRKDGRIVITGFRLAHIIASKFNGVNYVPCRSPQYVGSAHNHPPGDYPESDPCYHSISDSRTFRGDRAAQVDIVLCGRDRFVWVLKDDSQPRIWQAKSR